MSPFELFSFLDELCSLDEPCSALLCENDTLLLLCRLPTPVLRMEALLPASVIFLQSKIHFPFSAYLRSNCNKNLCIIITNHQLFPAFYVSFHNCLPLQSPNALFFAKSALRNCSVTCNVLLKAYYDLPLPLHTKVLLYKTHIAWSRKLPNMV